MRPDSSLRPDFKGPVLLMTMSEVKGNNLRQNQNSSSHCSLTLD